MGETFGALFVFLLGGILGYSICYITKVLPLVQQMRFLWRVLPSINKYRR